MSHKPKLAAIVFGLVMGVSGAANAAWQPVKPIEFIATAGPGGGTPEKPVGLVHTGIADERGQAREGPEAVAKLLPGHVASQRFEKPVGLGYREEVLPVPKPAAIAELDGVSGSRGARLEHRQLHGSRRLSE